MRIAEVLIPKPFGSICIQSKVYLLINSQSIFCRKQRTCAVTAFKVIPLSRWFQLACLVYFLFWLIDGPRSRKPFLTQLSQSCMFAKFHHDQHFVAIFGVAPTSFIFQINAIKLDLLYSLFYPGAEIESALFKNQNFVPYH